MESAMPVILMMYTLLFVVLAILGAVLLASYILQSIGLSAVAKRRGIERPWLAWVPVANSWTLGCVSDQYRYFLTGEDRNFRKKLLSRKILFMIANSLYMTLAFGGFPLLLAVEAGSSEALVLVLMFGWMFLLLLGEAAFIVFAVRYYIVLYKVLYDFYRSCNPKTSTLFFVLSFVTNIGLSLGFLLNRDNDLGMPPKPEEVPAE